MGKIIRLGRILTKKWPMEMVCNRCETIFEIDKTDISKSTIYFWTRCLGCGISIDVKGVEYWELEVKLPIEIKLEIPME